MNLERTLREIDAAYRMGIEVYVVDTGWYGKTGYWQVDGTRFPDGLKRVKERLEGYGMKLGLWFNPTVAALSSGMLARQCWGPLKSNALAAGIGKRGRIFRRKMTAFTIIFHGKMVQKIENRWINW